MIPRSTVVLGSITLVLAAILVVQLVVPPAGARLDLPAVDDEVDELVITRDGASLTLERDGDEWFVGPERWDGDEAQIATFLDLATADARYQIVSARGSFDRYGITDETLHLEVRASGEVVRTYRFGTASSARDAYYARVDGGSEVVLVPRALAEGASVEEVEYRELAMIDVPRETVASIEVAVDGFEPVRIEPAAPPTDGADGDDAGDAPEWRVEGDREIADQRIEDLLFEIAPLRAQEFRPADETGPPFATVTVVQSDGNTIAVAVHPPDEVRAFGVSSDAAPYEFTMPEWRVRRLLLGVDEYVDQFPLN